MAFKYARTGPPFNFLGSMTESQKKAFYAWLDRNTGNQSAVTEWHQIRALQLRKSAGLLEEFYKTKHPDALAPTFQKEVWSPSEGYFDYTQRKDQLPAVTVGYIKERFRDMLQKDDEGVFWMNWVRSLIEREEDQATSHQETPDEVKNLKIELDNFFNQPEYEAVLVKDQSNLYKGEPRFRVHPLDPPTIWEREQMGLTSSQS